MEKGEARGSALLGRGRCTPSPASPQGLPLAMVGIVNWPFRSDWSSIRLCPAGGGSCEDRHLSFPLLSWGSSGHELGGSGALSPIPCHSPGECLSFQFKTSCLGASLHGRVPSHPQLHLTELLSLPITLAQHGPAGHLPVQGPRLTPGITGGGPGQVCSVISEARSRGNIT